MAGLLTELQQLDTAAVAAARGHAPESDPLLLDEVYTCPAANQSERLSSSSHVRDASDSSSTGTTKLAAGPASPATVQHSSSSFTSGASLTSLAALASYKRQLYLGLDPASPAAAGPAGAAATRPASAALAAAPWQAGLAASRSFVLRSRPDGMSRPEFGPAHIPGYLPRPDPQDAAAASMPAQSGMGPVIAPRLYPRSSCPPAWQEPLTAPADAYAADVIAARQAEREALEDSELINRLVYDSLQPPVPAKEREKCAGAQAGSCSSSCRTTTSSKSLNICMGAVGADDMRTGGESAPEQRQQDQEQLTHQAGLSYAYAPGLVPWYVPESSSDTTLVFESRFESGNLRRAIQVTAFEYDLVLQPDINTRGHTQWFFFAVSNTRAGVRYRFNIINLLKEDSLYNMGMLPLMHSEQQMRNKGLGWVRWGRDVCYRPNSIVCRKKQTYYTLTFTMEFPHNGDLVHLAHCYPFTWTDQQNHLYTLKKSPPPSTLLQQALLATSLAGNSVDVLTITAAADRGRPMSQRQGVILSARVHPGETNASWLMKGALQQLLADTEEAARLRDNFVFKVVPMLNPDGVIVGNYRCSLAGLDLNRMYQAPDSRLQPVICVFKEMYRAFTQEREVVLSCDMHGHSRRFGIFMYGCEKKPGKDVNPLGPGLPVPGSVGGLPGVPVRHQERIFPLMLALNAPDLFSYRSCTFKVQKSKAGTGRVVGFRELGLVNAYTMEASFAGAAVGKYAKQHFNTGHLEEMGAAVVRTLLDYWAPAAVNSAQELCAQLDAALLQGVTDCSSTKSAGASGSSSAGYSVGGAGMGSALEKLGLGDAGDDEDVCTDSDDESSDDDKPAARNTAAAEVEAGSSAAASSLAFSDSVSAKGAASGCTSSAAALSDIGKKLADLLNGQVGPVGSSSRSVGGKALAAGGSAAAGAVKSLLDAIKATEAAGSPAGGAAGGALRSGVVKPPPSQVLAAATSNNTAAGSASSSKQAASSNPVQTVTAVAQQLLEKLATAKAKVLAGTAAAAAACRAAAMPGAAAAAAGAAAVQGSNAGCLTAGTPGSVLDTAPVDGMTASTAAASPSAAAAAAAGGSGTLSDEEAALLVMPGLQDILQQLVQQAAQQKSKAAASTAKKKGRRRGRWGNPEVLRAARAKADAGLAAALPELGILDADAEDLDADLPGCWDEGSYSSSSTPATPTPLEGPQVPLAGCRAHTAGSRSSKNASWNFERYMYCLEAQKRAVGGVLASSSTEPVTPAAWGEAPAAGVVSPGAAAAACGVQNIQSNNQNPGVAAQTKLLPHSVSSGSSHSHSSNSPFGGSKSTSRKMVAFAGADEQPDALEASIAAGCGAAGEPTSPGSRPPGGVSLQRRSKSAYPWIQGQTGSPT